MTRFIQRNRDIPNTHTQLDIIHRHDDGTSEARKYIADIYLKTYQATISSSPDVIICSRNADTKKIMACAGITFASQHEQLFSERYLPDLLEPLIQQQWGTQVGATERTLARLFVRHTGLRFTEWHNRLLLSDAWQGLADNKSNIELAIQLGFSSSDSLGHWFKRMTGFSPSHARKYLNRQNKFHT